MLKHGVGMVVSICIMLLSVYFLTAHVESTASQCRGPENPGYSTANRGRGGVVLSYASNEEHVHLTLKSNTLLSNNGKKKGGATTLMLMTPKENEVTGDTLLVYNAISTTAKSNVDANPDYYKITGPLNKQVGDRVPFKGIQSQKCVACVLDCMSNFPHQGQVFSSCDQRFYYYGCNLVDVCWGSNAPASTIQVGIGLCIQKNGCVLRDRSELGISEKASPTEVLKRVERIAANYSPMNRNGVRRMLD